MLMLLINMKFALKARGREWKKIRTVKDNIKVIASPVPIDKSPEASGSWGLLTFGNNVKLD